MLIGHSFYFARIKVNFKFQLLRFFAIVQLDFANSPGMVDTTGGYSLTFMVAIVYL